MRWLIAVGVLVLLAGPAHADAASLVYLDQASNVWIASPDGAIKRQLTSDATPDSLYLSPSMQDDGTVVVPNQDGFTRVLNPDGTNKSGPWSKPTPAFLNTALNWADTPATGSFYLAAQYTAPFGGSADPTVSLAALNAPGTSSCAVYVCNYDLMRPRFIPGTRDYTAITDGRDPVSYNGDYVRVVKADGTVVDWLGFTGPGTPDSDIRNVDISRTGDRILVEIAPKGITTSSSLTVLQETGPPPGGAISQAPLCSLNQFAAGDARPRFSPDATEISFTEPDGLHIASAPTAGPNGACALANDHLVIAGARDADWSPYTLPTPPPASCQTTGTCPPPPPRLSSATVLAGTLHGGIALRLVLSRAAQIIVNVQLLHVGAHGSQRGRKPRMVGTVRIQAHAGSNTVSIRRIGGKRLAKGRYRLSITVAGAATTTTARVLSITIPGLNHHG